MASSQPRITILDSHTLNPGDLNWDGLRALGDCTFYDRSAPDEVVERARDARIVVTNKAPLPAAVLNDLPDLQYIAVTATGFNIVDTTAARARGIAVSNVPTYGTNSVAQMVFAHILNLTQHVAEHAQGVRDGRWASADDWCFWDFPLVELEGSTLGVIGFGRIGQATGKLANAFGMRVLAYNPSRVEGAGFAEQTDLETLLRESDFVSLSCPLTAENERFINSELLGWMKPTAYLINTARGPLIDEAALADALNNDRLAGAGLDVVSVEPPDGDNPLFSAKNCYVTPHIAWATRESRRRLLDTTVDNVAAFLQGSPKNVVN